MCITTFTQYVNNTIFSLFSTNPLAEQILNYRLRPALDSVGTENDIPNFLDLVHKFNSTLLDNLPYSPSVPIEIAMYSTSAFVGMVNASSELIGSNNIAGIGDGSVTGAISTIATFSMCANTIPLSSGYSISELFYKDITTNLGLKSWDTCWSSCEFERVPTACTDVLACITHTPTLPGCERESPCAASTFSSLATAFPSMLTPEGGNEFQVAAADALC